MESFKENVFSRNITKFILILLVAILSMCSLSFVAKADDNSISGTWQTLIDGKESSDGGLFFRFEFNENGTVDLTEESGDLNLTETKKFERNGDEIQIISAGDDKITSFDNAVLTVKSDSQIDFVTDEYTGVINLHKGGLAFFYWLLIPIVLIGINELCRKYKWATIIIYFIIPFAFIPIFAKQGVSHWFKWVKLYSVVFAVFWFFLVRYTKFGKKNSAKFIAATILGLNILEAVSQDFSMGKLPNILNGLAGIFSIITLYYGWKGLKKDDSKEGDMVWPLMTTLWIIAYDVWNWVFVYLNFPGSASGQFMVIVSCTIPALFIKKGTWLQARGFTLAAWFIYYFTFPRFTESMQLMVFRNDLTMNLVAFISIILNVICLVVFLKSLSKDKKMKLATK
ncbi:DUF5692 family protein [Clostridium grantii]|nr:DUF5692 family protein [Clostridium grantii]